MTPRRRSARSAISRHLGAAAGLRHRVELAVVERLNPSVSIESLPLAILLALLASLIAMRRH